MHVQVDELLALLLPSGQTTHADAAGRLYERGGHPARAPEAKGGSRVGQCACICALMCVDTHQCKRLRQR